MLSRPAATQRVQADASRLPLADRCANAVVIGDGPLFASEVARVMADGPWPGPGRDRREVPQGNRQ